MVTLCMSCGETLQSLNHDDGPIHLPISHSQLFGHGPYRVNSKKKKKVRKKSEQLLQRKLTIMMVIDTKYKLINSHNFTITHYYSQYVRPEVYTLIIQAYSKSLLGLIC